MAAEKQITLSLKLFLQLWMRYKEYVVTDNIEGIVDALRAQDPAEEIIHIEGPLPIPDERHFPNTKDNPVRSLYKVWDIKYWRIEYERQILMKAESERTATLSIRRQEEMDKLVKGIMTMMSLTREMAEPMARYMYSKKQVATIEQIIGERIEPIDEKEFHMRKI